LSAHPERNSALIEHLRVKPDDEARVMPDDPVLTARAMAIAIEKAKRFGVGAMTLGNGRRHLDMAAYYAMLALPHDIVGCWSTGGDLVTVSTCRVVPRLGVNPHAWAVPAGKTLALAWRMGSRHPRPRASGGAARHERTGT
jgi:Malate/L-lactate dehydrogenase